VNLEHLVRTVPVIADPSSIDPTFWVYGTSCALKQNMADKILILDDDEQLVDAYRDYLSGNGYVVDCARELEEAQSLLAHFSYSVLITDLRLSKLAFGGLDLVKHVRNNSLATRIIVLTAYGWPELKAEAAASGADLFLRKPTELRELGNAIELLAGASL
jgi:two-component system OmpR family response regulator